MLALPVEHLAGHATDVAAHALDLGDRGASHCAIGAGVVVEERDVLAARRVERPDCSRRRTRCCVADSSSVTSGCAARMRVAAPSPEALSTTMISSSVRRPVERRRAFEAGDRVVGALVVDEHDRHHDSRSHCRRSARRSVAAVLRVAQSAARWPACSALISRNVSVISSTSVEERRRATRRRATRTRRCRAASPSLDIEPLEAVTHVVRILES